MARKSRKTYTSGQECLITFTADIKLREQLEVAASHNFRSMEEDIYQFCKARVRIREMVHIAYPPSPEHPDREIHSDEIQGRIMSLLMDDAKHYVNVRNDTASVPVLRREIILQREGKMAARAQCKELFEKNKTLMDEIQSNQMGNENGNRKT